MNERITLLALKASNPKTGWLDRQKFAELIVRECADLVDNLVTSNDEGNQILACDDIKTELLEHFGVDE